MDDATFEFCQDGFLDILSSGVLDVFEQWDLEDQMRDFEFMALIQEVVGHNVW